MGSCVAYQVRLERKRAAKGKDKIVYLKNIKVDTICTLKLSKKLHEDHSPKVPKIDIQKSDLYNRRKALNREKF